MLKSAVGIGVSLLATVLGLDVAWGGTATLSWDANQEPDLAGYRVYYRISGPYTTSIDVGRVTTYMVNGLAEGLTYSFVVTAYNAFGNQSGYSNEVSKTIPDTTGPVMSLRTVSQTGTNTAVITWQTNEPATTQVEYGLSAAYGLVSVHDPALVTSHRVTVTGLSSSTIYHFRIKSQDALGNLTVAGDATWAQTNVDSTLGTADLSIAMSGAPDPALVGQIVTYSITVTNKGPSVASEVTLTDALPSGVLFAGATASQGICIGASTLTCALGALASGVSATVVVAATATTSAALTNTVGVLSRVIDPSLANNSAITTTNGGSASRLRNISTRARALTGSRVLVAGLVIQGTGSKTVLIRGLGPTLSSFGVAGALANPVLELSQDHDSNPNTPAVLLCTNDDWGTPVPSCSPPVVVVGSPQEIEATGMSANSYAPSNFNRGLDAALLVTLPPGLYTVSLAGVSNGTGVALIGVDDVDTNQTATLVNISTRAYVGTGTDAAVGGFIISGTSNKQVLIRGFGPTLSSFGVSGALANPTLELSWDNDSNPLTAPIQLAINNDWGTPMAACNAPVVVCGTPQDIANTGMSADTYAPTNANRNLDGALLVTLPPGLYTVSLSGVSNGTGVGLIGVDEIGP